MLLSLSDAGILPFLRFSAELLQVGTPSGEGCSETARNSLLPQFDREAHAVIDLPD